MEANNNLKAQGRGWALYSTSGLIPKNVETVDGRNKTVLLESQNLFVHLPPWQCNDIFQLDSDIFSIVSQRAQIFSGMEDKITPIRSIEDEMAYRLKRHYHYAMQYDIERPDELTQYISHWNEINDILGLYNLRPDLSNFDKCIKLFFNDIKFYKADSAQKVIDWVYAPRKGEQIQDFKKKWVIDNLIHGRNAIQLPREGFDSFELLSGGTVYKVPELYIGQFYYQWYIQMNYNTSGYDNIKASKLFSSEDISTAQYLPNSSMTNGMKPLDSLMNFIITSANINDLLTENSNGEKPPEYLILVTEAPNEDSGFTFDSYDSTEQERQEQSVNEKRKDKGVRIHKMTGNQAQLMNLSRENLIATLNPYIDYVRKAKALAFHATPNEMGETDTGGMIAKSGAEAQEQLYYSQSINPLARMWENQFTLEILPKKFYRINEDGKKIPIWNLELKQEKTLQEKIALAESLKTTGAITNNEIREVLGYERTNNPADDEIQPQVSNPNNDLVESFKKLIGRR